MEDKHIVTLDDLMALPDVTDLVEEVEIPDLGTVRLRAISLEEHREIRDDCSVGNEFDMNRFESLLLAKALVEPVLTYDDVVKLRATKPMTLIDLLISQAIRVSRLTHGGEVSAKAVDDAEAAFRDEPDTGLDLRAGREVGDAPE